jgi:hypothetical protein
LSRSVRQGGEFNPVTPVIIEVMIRNIVVAIVVAVAAVTPPKYAGPGCLGPFCLRDRVTDRQLFDRIGKANQPNGQSLYCYEASQDGTFLYFETVTSEPHVVGDVFLSLSSNCMHMQVRKASASLKEWKTTEGIGLGSTEKDVLKAYGAPTARITINQDNSASQAPGADTQESIARLRIRGFRAGDRASKLAEHRLFYGPAPNSDDLRTAEFGINDGRVCWIFLSRND